MRNEEWIRSGVLCFHAFGWDLLDSMRESGFAEPELTIFTAPHYGYVGLQYVILATRETGPRAKVVDLASMKAR